jgi:hypothetical protein
MDTVSDLPEFHPSDLLEFIHHPEYGCRDLMGLKDHCPYEGQLDFGWIPTMSIFILNKLFYFGMQQRISYAIICIFSSKLYKKLLYAKHKSEDVG